MLLLWLLMELAVVASYRQLEPVTEMSSAMESEFIVPGLWFGV